MLALVHYLSRCYMHSMCPSQMPPLKHNCYFLYNTCTHTPAVLPGCLYVIQAHASWVLEKLSCTKILHSASLAIVLNYSVKDIWNRLDNYIIKCNDKNAYNYMYNLHKAGAPDTLSARKEFSISHTGTQDCRFLS